MNCYKNNFKSNKLKIQVGGMPNNLVLLDYHLDAKIIELKEPISIEEFFEILYHRFANTIIHKSSENYKLLEDMLADSTILDNVKYFFIVNGSYKKLYLIKNNNTWSTIFIKNDESIENDKERIEQLIKEINKINENPNSDPEIGIELLENIIKCCTLILKLLENNKKDFIVFQEKLKFFEELLKIIINVYNNRILNKMTPFTEASNVGKVKQLCRELLKIMNTINEAIKSKSQQKLDLKVSKTEPGQDYATIVKTAIKMIKEFETDLENPRNQLE